MAGIVSLFKFIPLLCGELIGTSGISPNRDNVLRYLCRTDPRSFYVKVPNTRFFRNYYALLDVTGDGQEELLLGQDNSCFNDIFTIRDGKVVAIEWGCYLNLCEDGVIRRTSYFPLDAVSDDLDNPRYYGFGRIEKIARTGKERRVTFLGLNCNTTTREWTMTNEETGEETPVSQEEVDEILSKYPLVDIEMKSISDFPS